MNIENNEQNNNLDTKDSVGKVTGFFLFRNLISSYNNDKDKSEDERKEIKKYGKISLTLSIIAIIISVCCIISNLTNMDFFGFSYVLMLVLYIFCGILISIVFAIYGFVFGVMQVRLNRKSIGIIGLVLSIFAIIVCVFLIVVLVI